MDAANIIAIVISICALGLTIYQGYQMRVSNNQMRVAVNILMRLK